MRFFCWMFFNGVPLHLYQKSSVTFTTVKMLTNLDIGKNKVLHYLLGTIINWKIYLRLNLKSLQFGVTLFLHTLLQTLLDYLQNKWININYKKNTLTPWIFIGSYYFFVTLFLQIIPQPWGQFVTYYLHPY